MFFYLLFLNVDYPPNVIAFLKLFNMSTLDFIPNLIGYLDLDLENNLPSSPKRFQENDYSSLFLQSGGNMFVLFVVSVLGLLFVQLILKIFKKLPNGLSSFLNKIKSSLEWSGILRIWISVFYEIMFAAVLQICALNFTTPRNGISSFLGLTVFILNCCLPFLIFFIVKRKVKSKRP